MATFPPERVALEAEADHLFSLIDINGDGVINQSEVLRVCRILNLPDETKEMIMLFADNDKNGDISREEFRVALSQRLSSTYLHSLLPLGAPLPTQDTIERAFSMFNSRKAPPGFIHVEDLKLCLFASLPAMERAEKLKEKARVAASSRKQRPASFGKKGGGPLLEPVEPGLEERVEHLIQSCGQPTPEGWVHYAEITRTLLANNTQ
jgi:Ca2+-binding EF-hand superfamily protein